MQGGERHRDTAHLALCSAASAAPSSEVDGGLPRTAQSLVCSCGWTAGSELPLLPPLLHRARAATAAVEAKAAAVVGTPAAVARPARVAAVAIMLTLGFISRCTSVCTVAVSPPESSPLSTARRYCDGPVPHVTARQSQDGHFR